MYGGKFMLVICIIVDNDAQNGSVGLRMLTM
jgi:hypothetical protein